MIGFWNNTLWPSLVGNGPEDAASLLVIGTVGSLLWPRTRRAINRWVHGHLTNHGSELHAKLDHLLTHLAAAGHIPPYHGMTPAAPHTVGATTSGTSGSITVSGWTYTKEPPHMSLLTNIESRFTTSAERVISDVEKAARSHVGETLLAAAKEILPLLPEGREASLVVTKLEEVEAWAHKALAAGAVAASSAETVTEAAATDAGVAETPAATEAAPAETAAPIEAAAPTGTSEVPPAA